MLSRLRPLFLALAITACADAPGFPPDSSIVVVDVMTETTPCGRLQREFHGSWTPSAQDIDALEPRLARFLGIRLLMDAELFGHEPFAVGDFVRKYSGVIWEDRRLIAICGATLQHWDERGDWRTTPLPVRDGGSSHFGALYDPATGNFDYFEFGYVG
jgi:hypothetical protein